MSRDHSGPAFPTGQYYDEKPVGETPGMTLRDYFAGRALTGLCALDAMNNHSAESLAIEAYEIAGAMLARRAKA